MYAFCQNRTGQEIEYLRVHCVALAGTISDQPSTTYTFMYDEGFSTSPI